MASIFESIDFEVNPIYQFWRDADELSLQDTKERTILKSNLMYLTPSGTFKSRVTILTPGKLYLCKGSIPSKMVIVTWKRLEAFCESNEDEERFGFRLVQRGVFQDFYVKTPKDLEKWLEALSNETILADLEEDFAIIKEIGSGNYAKVFLAQDLQSQKEFAIKSISKQAILASSRSTSALISEISVMRKLAHPYLLKLYKVYENDKYIHLILDYVPGGDLFHRIIERTRFSEENASKFMKNLLEAMDYMHSNNFIHRDLKPENILMMNSTDDFEFKIADFGLACECIEDQLIRCGSPGYVAPEILKKMSYSKKVDIFSAGIILYVLLSSRAPFFGKTQNEILMRNKECKIYFQDRYWKSVTKEGIDCVLRLTDSNPDSRPSAREALRHPWFALNFKDKVKVQVLNLPDVKENGISAELMRRMNKARGPDGVIQKKEEEDKGLSEGQKASMNQQAKNLLSRLREIDSAIKK